jgi:hypothetical protein
VVQPRKLPDGLLEARLAGSAETRLILVEVATYPEKRVVQQVCDDLRLVRQARGVLVDALVLCLCPRGTYRVPETAEDSSPLGWSAETLRWKVVELWTLSAEELLAAKDVAVSLWATLARYDGPPEVLLQRCRDRIERDGGEQKANLLAVAQVFAQLHFNRPQWLDILGGSKAMIESPLIQDIVEKARQTEWAENTARTLRVRFEQVTPTITAGLEQVKQRENRERLTDAAVTCASLEAFEAALRQELPKPPPASTRRKPKPKEKE